MDTQPTLVMMTMNSLYFQTIQKKSMLSHFATGKVNISSQPHSLVHTVSYSSYKSSFCENVTDSSDEECEDNESEDNAVGAVFDEDDKWEYFDPIQTADLDINEGGYILNPHW